MPDENLIGRADLILAAKRQLAMPPESPKDRAHRLALERQAKERAKLRLTDLQHNKLPTSDYFWDSLDE